MSWKIHLKDKSLRCQGKNMMQVLDVAFGKYSQECFKNFKTVKHFTNEKVYIKNEETIKKNVILKCVVELRTMFNLKRVSH